MSSRHLLLSVIAQALTGLIAVIALIYVLAVSGRVVNIEHHVRNVETKVVQIVKEVVPSNSNPHGRPGPAGRPARWPFPQNTLTEAF